MKIGIFDSGIGGMTIAQSIIKKNPQSSIVFFGDTAWFPYNDQSAEEIIKRSIYACELLISQGCCTIIIACNTSTAMASYTLKEKYPDSIKIYNAVDLTINALLKNISGSTDIGIIGTIHTIKSEIYEREIKKIAPQLSLKKLATPKLATLAEAFFINPKTNINLLYEYLESPELKNIDTLLLACTHYSILRKEIENYYNNKITVIDAVDTTNEVIGSLFNKKQTQDKKEKTVAFCSKKTDDFTSASLKFLGPDLIIEEI